MNIGVPLIAQTEATETHYSFADGFDQVDAFVFVGRPERKEKQHANHMKNL